MSDNIFWMAVNIYHEARSEPLAGQIAVCHVVLNRAEKRKMTAKEVILQPFQFSWHNGNSFPVIKDYEALATAFRAATAAVEERLNGQILLGANLYYSDTLATPPWWVAAPGVKMITKIGHHTFFKE